MLRARPSSLQGGGNPHGVRGARLQRLPGASGNSAEAWKKGSGVGDRASQRRPHCLPRAVGRRRHGPSKTREELGVTGQRALAGRRQARGR